MKKFRIGIIMTVVVAMFASIFALNLNFDNAYADISNYNQEIINSVNVDDEIIKEAASKEEPTKMYNLVVFIRFKDQAEFINEKYTVDGKSYSYLEILDASYNTSKYSLRNYYLTVSNNKLDITTIYLSASSTSLSSLKISNYSQKYFLAHEDRAKLSGYSNTEGYKTDSEMNNRSLKLANAWGALLQSTFDKNIRPSNANRNQTFDYSKLDYDNNGEIDSLTLQYYPQKTTSYPGMEWSGPLWSYKTSIFGLVSKTYTQNGVSKRVSVYTYNQTYMSFYNILRDVDKGDNNVVPFVNISTCIHEMGHVLGLPDLYSYEDQSGTTYKDLPVGYWSVMGFNSFCTGQFSTSYEREKMKWIDSSNVSVIEREGSYTLDVVKGGGNDGVVAYKIPIDNSTKHLYLEYRNNQSEDINVFDSRQKHVTSADGKYTYKSGISNSGLLVYVVNTSKGSATNAITKFKSSDSDKISWGIEVLSQYSYKQDIYKDNATLQTGESLGNKDLSSLDNAVYYYANDMTGKKNTGLYITVTEMTENTLTFDISGVDLLSKTVTEKEINNKLLYERLLKIAGTKTLTYDTFKNVEYMDLSDCEIDDVQFLNLFDLSNLKCINLFGNKLNVSQSTSLDYLSANLGVLQPMLAGGVKIILANNQIDLDYINKTYPILLSNSNILWGAQCIEKTMAFNESITIKYNFNSSFDANSTLKIIKTDLTGTSEQNLTGSGSYEFAYGAKYELKYEFYYNGKSVGTKSTEFNVVSISTTHDESNAYKVWNNKLGEIQYLSLLNIYPSVDGLSVDNIEFTETNGKVNKQLQINYLDNNVCSLDVYFEILSPEKISQTDLDVKLYQVLQTKYNLSGEIYDNDLLEYSVIDLSGQGLSSIKGLEKFKFKDGAIINLSNNSLNNSSNDEIKNLCSNNTNIGHVVLINNKYNSSDINIMRNNSSDVGLIFAMQNVKSIIISDKDEYTYEFDRYNDYGSLFRLTNAPQNSSPIFFYDLPTRFQITGCGTIILTFENDIVGKVNVKITLAKVVLKDENKQIELNYGEQFETKYEWFDMSPNDLDLSQYLTSNTDNVDFNTLGTYTITYSFADQTYILTQTIIIVDKQSPVITLNGKQLIYIDVDSFDLYSDAGASATDNYDKNLKVSVDLSELQKTCEKYKIYYTAIDSSGNIAKAYREVVVGSVTLNNTTLQQDIMTYLKLPIIFKEFKQTDFDIEVKLNNKIIDYNFNTGYKLTEIGTNRFNITLNCNIDNNLQYNLLFVANVVDVKAPVITLIGNKTVYLYESENYQESGITFTDNSVEGVYSLTQSNPKLKWSINYFKEDGTAINGLYNLVVGDYYVVYTVIDNYGNGLSSSVKRNVKVIYTKVQSMFIDENSVLPRYESGSDIVIEVSVVADGNKLVSMPTISWYINGECVQSNNSNVLNYKFTKKGEYNIYAVIENFDKNGNVYNKVYSNPFVVEVYSTNVLTMPILYVVIAIFTVAIIAFVIYFVIRRKNKYFY